MITCQVEKFDDWYPEAQDLLHRHWEEVGVNKESVPLDPDIEGYRELDRLGILHILTMREDGKLIGYYASLVKQHLHYNSTLVGFTDVYFVAPEKRDKPRIALRLFRENERSLKARGVKLIINTTKVALNKGKFLEYQGYLETDRVYMKVL